MKRIIAILLMAAMMLTFVACGKNNDNNNNDETKADNVTTQPNDEKEDKKENSNDSSVSVESVKKAKETDASLFEYEEVEGGISITNFNGTDEIVAIPEVIDGKTVVSIGQNCFINNNTVKGVRISDKVTVIGNSAFMNCIELRVCVLGESVKNIDMYGFGGCKKLDTIVLNDGLEVLGGLCFGATNLTQIEIPSSVTEINYPFTVNSDDHYITVIAEAGSAAEQYVNEKGAEYHLIFQAK